MAMLLRQSTTVTVQMGPALDKTDGVTEETALSPTVNLSKNGAAFAARNSATAITHDTLGYYRVEFNATDTNTLGRLRAMFHAVATHLPVWHDFMVITQNAYDALVAGTATLAADATLIEGVDATNQIRDAILSDATRFPGADVGTIKAQTDTVEASLSTLTTRIPDTLSLANINTEVDTALNTAIPGSPTADSINERVKAIDDKLPAGSIGDATAANQTTLLNRIGAFTGSGVNTVLGFFRALLSKTASTPSDVGGTFAASDDSTEAIRDRGDAAWITGAGGDVWATTLPGSYTSGQAGKILGDNLNATVSSRAAETSVDTVEASLVTLLSDVSAALTAITSKRTVGGAAGIDGSGTVRVNVYLNTYTGALVDCTACSLELVDEAGTVVIASGAWTSGPTENADNSWQATKTSVTTTAGKVYRVKVTLTHSSVAYTRFIDLNAVA